MKNGCIKWETRVGEFAVYPGHGVARIEEICTHEIAGQTLEFLVLRMVEDRSRILIPRTKADKVGIRPVMGPRDARQIWMILREATIQKRARGISWSRQFREYQEKLRKGSVFEIAEVLRDLLRLRQDRELSFGEHRVLDSARTLLVQELAAAQCMDAKQVEAEIKAVVTC